LDLGTSRVDREVQTSFFFARSSIHFYTCLIWDGTVTDVNAACAELPRYAFGRKVIVDPVIIRVPPGQGTDLPLWTVPGEHGRGVAELDVADVEVQALTGNRM
jgi:hypothetical protein